MGLGSWLLWYIRQRSLNRGRAAACVFLVTVSVLVLILSIAMVMKTDCVSIYVGFPLSLMLLPFALGLRIGKGLIYLFWGFICIAIITAVISVLYNVFRK